MDNIKIQAAWINLISLAVGWQSSSSSKMEAHFIQSWFKNQASKSLSGPISCSEVLVGCTRQQSIPDTWWLIVHKLTLITKNPFACILFFLSAIMSNMSCLKIQITVSECMGSYQWRNQRDFTVMTEVPFGISSINSLVMSSAGLLLWMISL